MPEFIRLELERARNTLAAYAFSKTRTSRNVLNGAGHTHRNRAIVHKHLTGFYWGIIHGLYHIFIVVYGRQATIHDSKYGTTHVLFSKYIHGKTDEK